MDVLQTGNQINTNDSALRSDLKPVPGSFHKKQKTIYKKESLPLQTEIRKGELLL